jgi:hypothetical protein
MSLYFYLYIKIAFKIKRLLMYAVMRTIPYNKHPKKRSEQEYTTEGGENRTENQEITRQALNQLSYWTTDTQRQKQLTY